MALFSLIWSQDTKSKISSGLHFPASEQMMQHLSIIFISSFSPFCRMCDRFMSVFMDVSCLQDFQIESWSQVLDHSHQPVISSLCVTRVSGSPAVLFCSPATQPIRQEVRCERHE